MPNHIKNRIEIIGTKEQVNEVIKRFSTFHEKTLNKTSDETMIICNDNDESANEFEFASKRGKKIKGLPSGTKYQYNEAF